MLIGLGEPFMDPKIFERIEFCHRHSVSTLLSTNGTFLDEKVVRPAAAIRPSNRSRFSFDGSKKETFEFYRKGAKFEKVRDNFVRFARMKHERGSKLQIVVQMVQDGGQRRRGGRLSRLLERRSRRRPGAHQRGRDQPACAPTPATPARTGSTPATTSGAARCTSSRTATCTRAARATCWTASRVGNIGEQPLVEIWNAEAMQRMRRLHATRPRRRNRYLRALLHHHPAPRLVAGSLLLHGKTVRRLLPVVERLTYLSKLPRALLRPPKAAVPRTEEFVQIETAKKS